MIFPLTNSKYFDLLEIYNISKGQTSSNWGAQSYSSIVDVESAVVTNFWNWLIEGWAAEVDDNSAAFFCVKGGRK